MKNVNQDFTNVIAEHKQPIAYHIEGAAITFTIQRRNNDINGNPLYKVVVFDKNGDNVTADYRGKFYRVYSSKGYALLQSYSISDSLARIFN